MVSSSDSRLPDWESDALTSAAETTGTGNEQGRDRWSRTLVARLRTILERNLNVEVMIMITRSIVCDESLWQISGLNLELDHVTPDGFSLENIIVPSFLSPPSLVVANVTLPRDLLGQPLSVPMSVSCLISESLSWDTLGEVDIINFNCPLY